MSRIERVMRELSDLHDFMIRLDKARGRKSPPWPKASASAETRELQADEKDKLEGQTDKKPSPKQSSSSGEITL